MKRAMVFTSVVVMLLAMCGWTLDAWARGGGGRSMGSRGSRSFSAPAKPNTAPAAPNQQAAPSSVQQPMPQRSGWMSGLMGGITGFMLGGMLGSLLFGSLGGGLLGGIGLLEILLIGGVIYFAFSYMRRRQRPAAAGAYGYPPPQGMEVPSWRPEPRYAATTTIGEATPVSDLERGLGHIRQMDSTFDPRRFTETATDVFCVIQAAWTARTMGAVREVLTAEMYETLQKECERLRAERQVNRLDNIAIRTVEVTEAWQESGQDFVTVHFLTSLLDYTIDETSEQVVGGSRTEPVKFEEYWTFVRPVGTQAWKLSAIQQA